MMLSTKGRYAVMAMVDLACQSPESSVALAAIAERQEIPLAYLEQIFLRLKRAGLVSSVRGPGGGYRLAQPADVITIAEVMRASEESLKMTRCEGEKDSVGCMASKAQCLTHHLWAGLNAHIEQYLQGVTLAEVVEKKVTRVQSPESSDMMHFLTADHWPLVTPL